MKGFYLARDGRLLNELSLSELEVARVRLPELNKKVHREINFRKTKFIT